MSWLLFYLLAALHPVAFLVIAWKCDTRKMRFLLWALLPLPAIWYCWDYFTIKNEHAQMCAAEGGLTVLIQPEKVDRVRLVGRSSWANPKATLEDYYPQVKVVEALTNKSDPLTGKPLDFYEAYTTLPNPKAGEWIVGSPQEGKFLFPSTRIEKLDPDVFELREEETQVSHRTQMVMTLNKSGKVYARHTTFVHWWTGIRYPDALPTWRCPDTNQKFPAKDQPNAPYEKWEYPPFAFAVLHDLILK
jgi:hypothetical protein